MPIIRHNLMICKKCGYFNTCFFEPDGNNQILNPTHCTKCGGELIDTGNSAEYWREYYLKKFPNVKSDKISDYHIWTYIAQQFFQNDPEALAQLEARVETNERKLEEFKKQIFCPKCYSSNVGTAKQGFKWGRAMAGAAITGFLDVAAVAGALGSSKMVNVCHQCGYKWK